MDDDAREMLLSAGITALYKGIQISVCKFDNLGI
jgi:hypothetical protein